MLVAAAGSVLLGTLYPLALDALVSAAAKLPDAKSPAWVYLTGPLNFSGVHGVTVEGEGTRYDPNASLSGRPRLLFTSASGGIVVTNCRGLNLCNLYVDGNSVVTTGITLDRLKHSVWSNVSPSA